MGMVFNTQNTTNLLSAVNLAFTGANFTYLTTPAHQPAGFANLRNLGGPNKIYDNVWHALTINECGVSARLKFWLGLLDSDTFKQTYNGTADYLSGWIGKGIYTALSTKNYGGIEFFAVPGSLKNISLSLPFGQFSDADNGGKLTLVITIYTDIVDNFQGHP
jgi:hypothetical protein